LNILASLIAPDSTTSIVAQNNNARVEIVELKTNILRHNRSSYSMHAPN
jgi:hypothetical protein